MRCSSTQHIPQNPPAAPARRGRGKSCEGWGDAGVGGKEKEHNHRGMQNDREKCTILVVQRRLGG